MPSVRLLFGPILIGVFLNMILYGVLLVQIYHYHLTYKKDAPWIKYLVYYLFAVETINTACDMAIVFQPLIENFGKPEATMYFPTMFAAEPIVIVAVSTPIQLFFAWRIKLLTKSNILALIVCALSITSLAGGAWTTGLLVKIKLFSRKPELHWPALVWFLSACVADVMITIVLVLTLSKRKTGFVATDGAIEKIIRLTVQTGMLTAFFAIGDIIFFMSLPHTALNFVWDLALSKLYSNCLLSTLNSRLSIQAESGFHPTYNKQGVSSSSGGAARRPGELNTMDVPGHALSSSLYELDTTHKPFGPSDIEYGVAITKIVETRQDPIPEIRRAPETQ